MDSIISRSTHLVDGIATLDPTVRGFPSGFLPCRLSEVQDLGTDPARGLPGDRKKPTDPEGEEQCWEVE